MAAISRRRLVGQRPAVTKVTRRSRGRKVLDNDRLDAGLASRRTARSTSCVIPTELKDKWNATHAGQGQAVRAVLLSPVLAKLLNQLYPQFGPFTETNRTDLVVRVADRAEGAEPQLHGHDAGGRDPAEPRDPADGPVGHGNRLGVLGGDLARLSNGRRLEDDVIDIAERAVGGVLIGHSLPLGDGVDANDVPYLTSFPYQADPFSGYDNTKGQQKP